MKSRTYRAAVARRLAMVSVLAFAAACQDLPTTPVAGEKASAARPAPDLSAFDPCQAGALESGALWQICLPPEWNGSVIVWAHGYVDPFEPLALPNDQIESVPISNIVLGLHYAYATTSYSHNGLVAAEGSHDLDALLARFAELAGPPSHAYVVGASEGSLSSILALERSNTSFDGGLAVCGPLGSFRGQIDYFGDFRVLFDYFFPGVLPGNPLNISQRLIAHWLDTYQPAVLAAIQANPGATQQLLRVSHAAIDPTDPNTIAQTVLGILWYNVFATNDANTRLGGNPYDNRTRLYLGSSNDLRLNLTIKRYSASPTALANLRAYETSGSLQRPVVSLHTTGDPIIPFWQQELYQIKVLTAPHLGSFLGFPVLRYGHCAFTQAEVLAGFALLVQETGGALSVPASLFSNQSQASRFLELAHAHGANASVIR